MIAEARATVSPIATPRRRFLLAFVAALLLISVIPAFLGWRLIATYAAIPGFRAAPAGSISLETHKIPPPSAGWGIAVAPDGGLFVSDISGGRLLSFPNGMEESGRVLASGVEGRALQVQSLALSPDGTLWLLEMSTGRVHIFTRAGQHLRSLALGSPGARCLAIDEEGRIFVSDPEAGTIRRFLPGGEPDLSWGDPSSPGLLEQAEVSGLAVWDAKLYAATRRELLVLDGHGRVSARGPLKAPVTELAAGPDGSVYASDFATNRVWVYSAEGVLLGRVVGPGREDLFAQPRGLALPGRGGLYVVNEKWVGVYSLERLGRRR